MREEGGRPAGLAAGPVGEDNREGEWAFRPKQERREFSFPFLLFYFKAYFKPFQKHT